MAESGSMYKKLGKCLSLKNMQNSQGGVDVTNCEGCKHFTLAQLCFKASYHIPITYLKIGHHLGLNK